MKFKAQNEFRRCEMTFISATSNEKICSLDNSLVSRKDISSVSMKSGSFLLSSEELHEANPFACLEAAILT